MKKTSRKKIVSIIGMISIRAFLIRAGASALLVLTVSQNQFQPGRIIFDLFHFLFGTIGKIVVGTRVQDRDQQTGGSGDQRFGDAAGNA